VEPRCNPPFRSLVTGTPYAQQNAVEACWIDAVRMAAGIAEVRASGNLRGKPAIILHGRSDALLPPNHTSRPYFGLNKSVEAERSQLSYIEVINGNHFDSFIPKFGREIPIFGPSPLVPMHYYFEQALALMRNHLLSGARPLPPSQVIAAKVEHEPWDTPEKARMDMPDISITPSPEQLIAFNNDIVDIPIQ
jgi:hydroxybutyrate-dimer hydrolase